MNYRHAFHAGNFADCMKHAVLVWLLRALARKDKAFAVLDSHAGIGRYDLSAGPAERTGEWRAGIGRLRGGAAPELADYLGVVERLGLYPGSPAIVRALLRPGDRLVCCELHPEDAMALKRAFRGDPQVAGEAAFQRADFVAHRPVIADDSAGPVEHAQALRREADKAGLALHQ